MLTYTNWLDSEHLLPLLFLTLQLRHTSCKMSPALPICGNSILLNQTEYRKHERTAEKRNNNIQKPGDNVVILKETKVPTVFFALFHFLKAASLHDVVLTAQLSRSEVLRIAFWAPSRSEKYVYPNLPNSHFKVKWRLWL